jgi:hypothetical protein
MMEWESAALLSGERAGEIIDYTRFFMDLEFQYYGIGIAETLTDRC